MTDTDISMDMEWIEELVEEYADAEHRRERREIENRVLAETVWQVPENQRDHEGDLVL